MEEYSPSSLGRRSSFGDHHLVFTIRKIYPVDPSKETSKLVLSDHSFQCGFSPQLSASWELKCRYKKPIWYTSTSTQFSKSLLTKYHFVQVGPLFKKWEKEVHSRHSPVSSFLKILPLWDLFYINVLKVYFYYCLILLDESIIVYSAVSKHILTPLGWWPTTWGNHFTWDVSVSICTENTWEGTWQNSSHVYISNVSIGCFCKKTITLKTSQYLKIQTH